ncbi:MAG: ribbon-helix-helix protein, CopG family [Myxococcota bacterium]
MTTKATTHLTRKTAIAVPADLLEAVDRSARARGESRSRFIQRVLREAVRARRDADITRRLNALFEDKRVADQQQADSRWLDSVGTSWEESGW